ncbi:porin [Ferrimonas marina]|uniref:Outer membrane protein (Porin) n=1 Tax=Ferrimonas marina TaxID=299255 RepID=A0A1M5VSW4_9GAMM|nr:porin [Ferrimonas marina]SHH78369.1 Outer membrane protein (porin) [Ferrimonas marina]
MKKHAFMVLGLAMTLPAQADSPEVYGRFWLAANHSDNGLVSKEKVAGGALENYASFVGIKGEERLSETLAFIYKFEAGFENFDNSDDKVFKSRNTYIGFDSSYGQVVFGRNDTVFKKTEGRVDQFNITAHDMDLFISGNDRLGDSVTYYSPKLAGVTLGASYTLKDDFGGRAELDGANNYAISATLGDPRLSSAGHYLGVSYADGLNGLEAVRVVGGIKLGAIDLGALYQHSDSLVYDQLSGSSALVSAAWKQGAHTVKAQAVYDDAGLGKLVKNAGADLDSVEDAESWGVSLGYDYKLSKPLTLGAALSYVDGEYRSNGMTTEFDDVAMTVHTKFLF